MDAYTKLAIFTIKEYIKTGKKIDVPKNLPQKMINNRAGVFVSIHKKSNDELRGCIGTFLPTKNNIAQEIIDNAISACSSDYRFNPINENELSDLEVSVDVLEKPEPIQGLSSLDPKKYGVIVKSEDGKTGLLLPDLPDVNDPKMQIAIARQKAGIKPDETVYLYRFKVKNI